MYVYKLSHCVNILSHDRNFLAVWGGGWRGRGRPKYDLFLENFHNSRASRFLGDGLNYKGGAGDWGIVTPRRRLTSYLLLSIY